MPTTGRLTFGRVVRSEWIKLRSLRSSVTLLVAAAGVTVIVGALGSVGLLLSAADGQPVGALAVHSMPTSGLSFGQLVLGALAALAMTSEYATGMIRPTLTVVPTRMPVLAAKALVAAVLGFLAGTTAAFTTYVLSQPILAQQHLAFGLGEPGILWSLCASGLYLALVGVLGTAVGALVRHGAGAIVSVIGLLFVLPAALSMMSGAVAATVLTYLPSEAGTQMLAPYTVAGQLTQAQGAAVLAGWALIPMIAAIATLRTRDA